MFRNLQLPSDLIREKIAVNVYHGNRHQKKNITFYQGLIAFDVSMHDVTRQNKLYKTNNARVSGE